MAIHFAYNKQGIDTWINLGHDDDYDGDTTDYYVGDSVPAIDPQSNAATFSLGDRHVQSNRAIRPYDPNPDSGIPYDES